MTLKKRFLRITHLLFLILLAVQFLQDKVPVDTHTAYVIVFFSAMELLLIGASFIIRKEQLLNLLFDVTGSIYIFLIVWTLLTAKFNYLKTSLFPPPGAVFYRFTDDLSKITVNIQSSLGIILEGYILAAAAAIPLGLFLGWNARAGSAAAYISKFLSSIPPIVYIPYGIALLPTFRSVSVFVIFLAAFWPIFGGTMSGVMNVESKLINSAKVLDVNRITMMFSVILPAALPQIFLGCNQGLTVAFILLTSAEMIGASDGIGYYVKQYSDFGDYTRAITGIIVIGIVVVTISFLFNKLQRHLTRWKG